jgi:hypothetical protein
MGNLPQEIGSVLGKIKPFLTDGPDALRALLANQDFPARTLLITLVVIAVLCWLIVKLIAAALKTAR